MPRTRSLGVSSGLDLEAKAEEPRRWMMPVPRSNVVRWKFGDGSGDRCSAIVTKVNANSIDVMIFPSGVHLPQPRTGVKHTSDPSLKGMSQPNPGGIWEFTELELLVRSMTQSDDE